MGETNRRTYLETHPWISFRLDLSRAPADLWVVLGECQSKCEHLAGVPLQPERADEFYQIYLAKGVQATTAIEGNTLSEEQVRQQIRGELHLPPSRQYLQQEVRNVVEACNQIVREVAASQAHVAPERIKRFNALVLEGLDLGPDVKPGRVSDHMVGVGRYRGCPRQDCDYLLDRLCQWLDGDDFRPFGQVNSVGIALLKAVMAHLYIAWIHPFADGNGRTARLLEFQVLFTSGVPAPAAHLLSNFYNQTRTEYYRQLDRASGSGGNVLPFLHYAAMGFRDGLREQIDRVRDQQWDTMWANYVYDRFRGKDSEACRRQRNLVLDLSEHGRAVPLAGLRQVSPRMAEDYAGKTARTLTRDVNALLAMDLIVRTSEGYRARRERILAWLPPRVSPEAPDGGGAGSGTQE